MIPDIIDWTDLNTTSKVSRTAASPKSCHIAKGTGLSSNTLLNPAVQGQHLKQYKDTSKSVSQG